MITNITPSDREEWDRRMKDHSRRLKRQENGDQAKRSVLLMIAIIVIIWLSCWAVRIAKAPYVPQRTPEMIMEDTLPINHK